MIRDKIVETYINYLKTTKEENPNLVILLKPKTMIILKEETMKYATDLTTEIYKVQLFGNEIPLIVKNNIPEDVEFIIMSRKDYEEWESGEKIKDWIEKDIWNIGL